jgi:sodium/bile acid cotransporter 7
LGFARADRMVMLFCGSTKSLASGVPIAVIIFPADTLSLVILPIMLYHQLQLIVCAGMAQREAHRIAAIEHAHAGRDMADARVK